MPEVAISTPFNISIDLTIAPVWKRGLAYVIDILILYAYRLIYVFVIQDNLPNHEGWHKLLQLFLFILPVALYHFLMEVFFSGQSLGKRIMNIRVVNFTGNEASVSQYLIRLLFRSYILAPLAVLVLISIFYDLNSPDTSMIIVLIILLFALANMGMFLYYVLNKYGQRIGDMLANTLVIETRAETDIHKTIYLEITDQSYKVRYPEVMRLTDRDINGIRNMLDIKKATKDSEAYMHRIAARIEEVLGIQSGQEPYDFLAQLLRDYNFLTSK